MVVSWVLSPKEAVYKGGRAGGVPFSSKLLEVHYFGERTGNRYRYFARHTGIVLLGTQRKQSWVGLLHSLCIRRLTMLQLASTCEAMGIPKDTVKDLRRWDRVHMIKELAGVAVRFQ